MKYEKMVKKLKSGINQTRKSWNGKRYLTCRGNNFFLVQIDGVESVYTPSENDKLAIDWKNFK